MRFAAVAFVFLLNACASSGSLQHTELDQEFHLKFNETVTLRKEDLTIRFNSLIQESRCPKEVHCIQAGKASIGVELMKPGEKKVEVELSTESASNETTYGHFKIKLVDVTPYPIAGEKPDPAQYVATLVVSKSKE